MLLILIMNKNLPLHPNSSYYQMCISKRQKSYIIINIIRQPKRFLDLKEYHSLEHAETHFSILILILRKMNGLFSTTFTLEQKSGFKPEKK